MLSLVMIFSLSLFHTWKRLVLSLPPSLSLTVFLLCMCLCSGLVVFLCSEGGVFCYVWVCVLFCLLGFGVFFCLWGGVLWGFFAWLVFGFGFF